jgi:hypothetical protein
MVEEDLDFPWLAGPATSRCQVDHLAVMKRLPGVLVHLALSIHHGLGQRGGGMKKGAPDLRG